MLVAASGFDWGQIAFMVLAAFVLVLQLINNLLNNRNNKEVIQKADEHHKELVQLTQDQYTKVADALDSKMEKLHDNLLVFTTNMSNMLKCVEHIDQIMDFRDEEGRRRIYMPNSYEATQSKQLELLSGLVQSQKDIARELSNLKASADNQQKQCQNHMFETQKLKARIQVDTDEV